MEGERWVFSIAHPKALSLLAGRAQQSTFWRQGRSQKQSPGQQLWWIPFQSCLMREGKDMGGCKGGMQQGTGSGYQSGFPSSVRKAHTDGEGLYTRAVVIGQGVRTLN